MYGFSTGFLQFRDDVLVKGSQEPVRLPYGYVCCMYGSVWCMCEHRTDPYVLENTRRIIRSLYVARTGPGDGRECTYEFLAPYDCLRAFYGEKRYKGSIRAEKKPVELRAGPYVMPYDHPRVTGILALTVPVNYPGAPCDLGITQSHSSMGFNLRPFENTF